MERIAVLVTNGTLLHASTGQLIAKGGKRRGAAIFDAGPFGLHISKGIGGVRVAAVYTLAGGVVLVAEHGVVADLHADSRLPEGEACYAGCLAHFCGVLAHLHPGQAAVLAFVSGVVRVCAIRAVEWVFGAVEVIRVEPLASLAATHAIPAAVGAVDLEVIIGRTLIDT